ncbi:hypothetical protein K491DRAFT_722677 [Lophiostoma macrostomum CBS 122681]|uniref:Uncharacterized protein n=1 Tax=Lophiostoma macrostomum CBS 122681 TaxID=1314788 RepID=A0A6A6SPK8_9PLEO|nr:hypothetical protein K491DRAFT_722677 [Lophiostoma macrostomum CBS 122681]
MTSVSEQKHEPLVRIEQPIYDPDRIPIINFSVLRTFVDNLAIWSEALTTWFAVKNRTGDYDPAYINQKEYDSFFVESACTLFEYYNKLNFNTIGGSFGRVHDDRVEKGWMILSVKAASWSRFRNTSISSPFGRILPPGKKKTSDGWLPLKTLSSSKGGVSGSKVVPSGEKVFWSYFRCARTKLRARLSIKEDNRYELLEAKLGDWREARNALVKEMEGFHSVGDAGNSRVHREDKSDPEDERATADDQVAKREPLNFDRSVEYSIREIIKSTDKRRREAGLRLFWSSKPESSGFV